MTEKQPSKEAWINVNDRLPPDFEEVMFFYIIEDMYKKDIVCGHRANGVWHICYLYESVPLNDLIKVTHWMPLPQFPNMKHTLYIKNKL